jgi:glycosyltransferase involved in cell wall biosynthesis
MIILEHSTYDGNNISRNFGAAEYSYWFVRRAFRPVLRRFGIVIPVTHPGADVEGIVHSARDHGISSVFFSFNPPHCTPAIPDCPTVPVFAWEYNTIPDEVWHDDPLNDWSAVLARVPAAITHSSFSAASVRRAMGADYPIWTIPAPVYGTNASRASSARGWHNSFELRLSTGLAIDSRAIDLALFRLDRVHSQGAQALDMLERAAMAPNRPPQVLHLSGVIYSTVLNPVDGRKNWMDLVAGFVWAFRAVPEATLLLKVSHRRMHESVLPILIDLAKFGAFKCRVIVIHGLLDDVEYAQLVDATTYTVNTSRGEGQCLPLMEFMAAGRPAIAPLHSAMLDYITDENAFVVDCHQRPAFWPHDIRQATRCLNYQPNFADLVRRYQESFRVARDEPGRYASMSDAATRAQAAFCSDEVVTARLRSLFDYLNDARSGRMEVA